MNKMLLMMTIAAACAGSGAYAGNGYIGMGFGGARSIDAGDNIAANETELTQYGITNYTSSDRSSTALSLLAGYRFNRFLAAEFNYINLGAYELLGYAGPNRTLPAGDERNAIDVLSLTALFSVPFGHAFGIYAKAGPALATVDQDTCVSDAVFCDSSSDTANALHGAVGLRVTPRSLIGELRVEYSRFQDIDAGHHFTAGDFDLWELQYIYNFGD